MVYFPDAYSCTKNGHMFVQPEGTLSSPNYPNLYPNDLNCSWSIKVPGKRVMLSFITLDLEPCCDHLSVSSHSALFIQYLLQLQLSNTVQSCEQNIRCPLFKTP